MAATDPPCACLRKSIEEFEFPAAVIYDISQMLDTGLDRESLAILVALVENGVNPEALAAVVKELRREAAALKVRRSPLCIHAFPQVVF